MIKVEEVPCEHLTVYINTQQKILFLVLLVKCNLVALDVPILRIHGRRVPRHVQLGRCCRLNGHILGWGCRNCWTLTHKSPINYKQQHFSLSVQYLFKSPFITFHCEDRKNERLIASKDKFLQEVLRIPASPTNTSWGGLLGPSPTALYTLMRIS